MDLARSHSGAHPPVCDLSRRRTNGCGTFDFHNVRDGNRTRNPPNTNRLLYLLSYTHHRARRKVSLPPSLFSSLTLIKL